MHTNNQKMESKIEQFLQGTDKDEWTIIGGTVQTGTNALQLFESCIEAFRTICILEPAAIDNQKSFLQRTVQKNDKLSVLHFLDRLKQINLLVLAHFLNSTQQKCYTNEEIKRVFYFTMPMCWQTNFINSGHSLHNSTMGGLRTYMVHQEHQTNTHRKKLKGWK